MIKKLNLEDIYTPISSYLVLLEEELDNTVQNLSITNNQNIFKHSFKIPGKRMRPALLLLSANAVNSRILPSDDFRLVQLSTALELIHTASLIHDDVIDEDLTRRGQKTLNNEFGNKIAVLAGDVLNSRAFLIISKNFPIEYHNQLTQMIETMSLSEIEQLGSLNGIFNKDSYLKIINGKTALFMGNSCRFGAMLAGGSEDEITALENYGINIGMAYQLIDDIIDKESVSIQYEGLKLAEEYANKAKHSISILKESVYKEKLIHFLDYILNYAPLD